MNFDLILRDKHQELLAVVELKAGKPWSAERAAEYRRNLIVHGLLAPTPKYFLFLTPEQGYLWIGTEATIASTQLPQYTFPMNSVLERYGRPNGGEPSQAGRTFESIAFRWLNDFVESEPGQGEEGSREPEFTLTRSGFHSDVQGAMVQVGAPA